MLLRHQARGLATFGLALACAAEARAGAQALRVRAVELGTTLESFVPADAVLPLTTTSVLIRTWGPNLHTPPSCEEGVAQLVERLDRGARVTPIPTPVGTACGWVNGNQHLLRLSATRVLMSQFGPDRMECTDDDGVFLVDDLGGANTVTPISLGVLCQPYMARLADDMAAVTVGRFGEGTALISGIGVTNEITWLPPSGPITVLAPDRLLLTSAEDSLSFVRLSAAGVEETPLATPNRTGEMIVLDPTSVLVRGNGADGQPNSADDVALLFRDLGPSHERLELPTPYAPYSSQTVRLSPTRALVTSNGPDREPTTADDEVLLLDHLDGTPTLTSLEVPRLMPYTLVALGPDLALATARSPAPPRWDEVVVLRDLGTASNPSSSPIGVFAPDWIAEISRPARVGPRTAAIGMLGPDHGWPSRDDQVAMVTVTAEWFELRTVNVPYLWRRSVIPLPPTGALAGSFGPGIDLEERRDDGVFAIGGVPEAPTLRRRKALNISSYPSLSGEPVPLGNGRAVFQDWVPWDGSNARPHHLQVIRGLDGGIRLRARQISIRFGPAGDARLAASAELFLPEPEQFASSDLAVRVGNATQTLPKGAFEATGKGFRYLDPGGAKGFLRRVEYDTVARRLEIEGQGTGTGAETTKARNLVLSLESLDLYAAESLDGARLRTAIVYPRP
jgi:hypothetical protein